MASWPDTASADRPPNPWVGHDRGARTGHRLVLDYPDSITRFAVLDIMPTRYALRHLTLTSVTANYQWFFLATGRTTHPTSAATRCPPATSSPKKHPAWSLTRYEASSTSARTTRSTSAVPAHVPSILRCPCDIR